MNTVKKMLSQYSSLLKNKLSPENKADIELRRLCSITKNNIREC